MDTLRTLSLFVSLSTGLYATAMGVDVWNLVPSHCDGPTGVLRAEVSGGIPPYSYQWSTGDTAVSISGLLPGTYTVIVTDATLEVVTAQGEVSSSWFSEGGQLGSFRAHCPGGHPMVDLTLYNEADVGAPIWGTGPFTITGPSSVVGYSTLPAGFTDGIDSVVRVEMNVPPGSAQTITWTDATGCPGQSTVLMSTEAVWPQVLVYGVQGSCAGGNNGRFSFSTSPATDQQLTLFIYRPDGTPLTVYQVDHGASATRTQLAPGDYHLVVYSDYHGPFDDELCGDTTVVTVPDLGNTCGHVSGTVFIDGNANCVLNVAENRLPQAIVEFTPGPYYASTNTAGGYSTNLPLGTYQHQVVHPGAQQECPGTVVSATAVVTRNIGCSSLFPLDVQLTGSNGPARPGFELQYALNVANNTAGLAGATTLTFAFDPALAYASAIPAPSAVAGNTLTWDLQGVGAYQNTHFIIRFTVPPDVALIGTTLLGEAVITTTNVDAVPANNAWSFEQVVTGSYDPNDKQARTSTGGTAQYLIDQDEWIDYTIRFQNTGTDTAFLVVITDTLPATLDPATIRIGAASHPFSWTLAGSGILSFNFPGILLPDSNVNEPLSHGFVSFRIRLHQPVVPGTVIENIANIYFDYNPPVITDPCVLVAEFSTAVQENADDWIQLMPNPTDGVLFLHLREAAYTTVQVLAMDGRTMEVPVQRSADRLQLDVRSLPAGVYVVRTAEGSARFVKR